MSTTLEKVRRLEQYLAADNTTVDAILETTIDKLLAREQLRISELKSRLDNQCRRFEKQYNLDSPTFYQKYQNGELGDDIDFIEWAATIEMLENIEKRLGLLEFADEPGH
jgi:hypothetical protein